MLMSQKRKRLPNSGSFKKGFDPRRHILSLEERRKGYDMFLLACHFKRIPSRVSASVRKRIRGYYQQRNAARREQRGEHQQEITA